MPLEPGVILNQRYRIISILGQGGMGAVYHALDLNLGVDVALKENLYLSEEFGRQFKREAAILATLKHPNLPRVSDHFEIKGQGQYLVMDYMIGEDLRLRMDRTGVLTDDEAVTIGTAICDALDYLHTRQPPIIHRDVKPGNIRIASDGHISLVDFGLAKLDLGGQETTTGARAMTPGYSPPEQYGSARTDPRSDIYSLGATLYAALCGCAPEDSLSRATGFSRLTPVRKHNPKVSKKLISVIDRAMDIHPEKRYHSALDMKKALLESIGESASDTRVFLAVPTQNNKFESDATKPSTELKLPEQKSKSGKNNSRQFFYYLKIVLISLLVLGVVSATTVLVYVNQTNQIKKTQTPAILNTPTDYILPVFATDLPPSPSPAPSETPDSNAGSRLSTVIAQSSTIVPTFTTVPFTGTELPLPTPLPVNGTQQVTGEIAFVSMRTGISQIWKMDAQGQSLKQMTDMKEGACQPSWSPDGKKLVFISPCLKREYQYPKSYMYTMNADGSKISRIDAGYGGNYDPAWSPDGKQIAFTKNISGSTQVSIINIDEGIVIAASQDKNPSKQPAWSKDGRYLAYILTKYSAEIWIRDNLNGNSYQLTHTRVNNNSWPVWLPSGKEIIFTQSPLDQFIPWLASVPFTGPDGAVESKIPLENHPVPSPADDADVSPDGKWLAFEAWPENGNHDIYIMTLTGENVIRLTDDIHLDFQPVWRP